MKHILIVEDDRTMRYILGLRLQSQNYRVDEATNGKEAVEKASNCNYDLILMDLHMPIMNGFKAASEIRAQGYMGLLIGITGSCLDEDMKKAKESGFDDCLNKLLSADFEKHIAEILY